MTKKTKTTLNRMKRANDRMGEAIKGLRGAGENLGAYAAGFRSGYEAGARAGKKKSAGKAK